MINSKFLKFYLVLFFVFLAEVISAKNDKAIIILPGIMGSKIYEKKDGKFNRFFPPGNEHPFESEIDPVFTTIYISNNKHDFYIEIPHLITSKLIKSHNFGSAEKYTDIVRSIYYKFKETDTDIIFYPYNWLNSNHKTALKLKEYIDKQGYNNVVFVCHSMGGIVVSDLAMMDSSKIGRVITLGTPFYGSPIMWSVFDRGDVVGGIEMNAMQLWMNFDFMDGENLSDLLMSSDTFYELSCVNNIKMIAIKETQLTPSKKAIDGVELKQWYTDIESKSKINNKIINNIDKMNNGFDYLCSMYTNNQHVFQYKNIDYYSIVCNDLSTPQEARFVRNKTNNKLNMFKVLFDNGYKTVKDTGDGTVPKWSSLMDGHIDEERIVEVSGISHGDLIKDKVSLAYVNDLIGKYLNPTSLIFVIDRSGSITQKTGLIESIQNDAEKFVDAIGKYADYATVINFGGNAQCDVDALYTNNTQELTAAIKSSRFSQSATGTAINDSIVKAVKSARKNDKNPIIVLFTDGGENQSTKSFKDAILATKLIENSLPFKSPDNFKGSIPVMVVGYKSDDFREEYLKDLAGKTQGFYVCNDQLKVDDFLIRASYFRENKAETNPIVGGNPPD